MTRLTVDISMSLDGYVAGPNPSLEDPLGAGGESLHEWAFAASAWQQAHGREGGEAGPDTDVLQEHIDAIGASIMGRNIYSGGDGPWESDPRARGWWGDAALEQARAAAGGKDVAVAGGAEAVQQYLRAGLVDTMQVHVAPVLLGGGTRLLDGLGDTPQGLELDRVVASPTVTHLCYRVAS